VIQVGWPVALVLFLLVIPVVRTWSASRHTLPMWRSRLSLGTRLLLFSLVILALADLRLTRPAEQLAVVFLLDRSESLDAPAREWQEGWVREALRQAGPKDQAGVVVFGLDAVVERSVRPARGQQDERMTSVVDPQGTDLASALRLAQASFPADCSRRIVVLSDGRPTAGDALTEARLAAAHGTEVWTAIPPARAGQEVLVRSLEVPNQPTLGQPFDVRITVQSDQEATAVLSLTADEREVARREVDLRPGPNVFLVPQRRDRPGPVRYEVRIQSRGDPHAGNNRASALALVGGRSRVLFVTAEQARPGPLPDLLRAAGMEVRVAASGALPRSAAEFAGYSGIIFSDVPALEVSESRMETLRQVVTEAGVGFAMLGGASSFGAGGWYRTPIESILPVDMDLRRNRRGAVLALALVLDKSGSMGEREGSVTRLAMAREAALAASSLLGEQDQVGAVAFDSAARWVVPMQRHDNPAQAAAELASLEAGGGTDLFPALKQALEALEPLDVPLKHAIVLSDGRTEPGDFTSLAKRAHQARISLSTVAIGGDADLQFLRDLAEQTGGRSYLADQATLLPRIFTRETILASRAAFGEKAFQARLGASHPALRNLTVEGAPELRGYNLTTLRPAPARMLLRGPEDDPLLAVGRAGLGRTAAWTSDAGHRWAASWKASGDLGRVLARVLRWTMATDGQASFQIRLEEDSAAQARVVVQAADLETPLVLQGRAVGPDGASVDLDLVQTGPGRFESPPTSLRPGAWLIRVSDQANAQAALATWSIPDSPELSRLQPDPAFMARLATAGDGLAQAPASTSFRPPQHPLEVGRPAWSSLLALALLLLPLDVALRRVFLPPGWWVRGPRPPGTAPAASPTAPTLAALLKRKQGTREEPAAASRRATWAPPTAPPSEGSRSAARIPTPRRVVQDPPAPPAAPSSSSDTLSRLRRARQRVRAADPPEATSRGFSPGGEEGQGTPGT